MTTKVCTKCGIEKDLCEFNLVHRPRRDGIRVPLRRCKTCCAIKKNLWYLANKQKTKDRSNLWKKANTSKVKESEQKYRKRYGAAMALKRRQWKKSNRFRIALSGSV
jgi:hypothetical protein